MDDFSTESGPRQWYLYETENGNTFEEVSEIIASVQCSIEEPRRCMNEQETLIEIREKVRRRIKNSYLKKAAAPVGVNPKVLAWMEIN